MIHLSDMTPGPPVTRPYSKRVVMPVMTEMTENEMPVQYQKMSVTSGVLCERADFEEDD